MSGLLLADEAGGSPLGSDASDSEELIARGDETSPSLQSNWTSHATVSSRRQAKARATAATSTTALASATRRAAAIAAILAAAAFAAFTISQRWGVTSSSLVASNGGPLHFLLEAFSRRPETHRHLTRNGVIEPLVATIGKSFRPPASVETGSIDEECHYNKTHKCPVEAMPAGKTTAVYPGGETRCLLGSSKDYFFQVIPGSSNKLLIHFDMGGACWDEASLNAGLCLSYVSEISGEGIFDISNVDNPYADYTFVVVGYCSGDVHGGAAIRDWRLADVGEDDVQQMGFINAVSAVQWALDNLGNKRLESLVLTGSSAGAIGVQIWARRLLESFDFAAAAVISDSFAGVFPDGVQGRVQEEGGLCETGLLHKKFDFVCKDGALVIADVYEDAMEAFPDVLFTMIDGKIDEVQIAFYQVLSLTLRGALDLSLDQVSFSMKMASIYRRHNYFPNFVSYMANSANHMFLVKDILYRTRPSNTIVKTSDAASSLMDGSLALTGLKFEGDNTPLLEWLQHVPLEPGESLQSVCRGVVGRGPKEESTSITHSITSSISSIPGMEGFRAFADTIGSGVKSIAESGAELSGMSYCDPGQADKVFVRPGY